MRRRTYLETTKVLTSMTQLAAITAKRAMMFITRMVLSMMKPGPARDLLKSNILW